MTYTQVKTFSINIEETQSINNEIETYSTTIDIKINDSNHFKIFSKSRKIEIINYLKDTNEIFIENKDITFMFHIEEEFIKIESAAYFFTTDLWFENNEIIKNEINKLI